MQSPLIVVAGLITDDSLAPPFLMTRRMPGVHLANSWEFPGGKLEPGEAPPDALVREIREELGIEVVVGDVYAVGHHEYPEKTILLLVYRVAVRSGQPKCLGVAEFAWLMPEAVCELPLPPADAPVLERLRREYVDL